MHKVLTNWIGCMAAACVVVVCVVGGSVAQEAKMPPDGTIEFTGGSAALGIGYSWGSGTLHYKGKAYPFTASGFTLADIGATQNKVTAEVYKLSAVEEFPGTYSVAQTGGALVGGGGIGYLQNDRGVVLKVLSNSQGARLTLGVGGVTIAMK
ncbi:EipA family protein [Azospirillum sp. TSO22-1]|uniref:EipA family protein n=1 Tax=Azospirillum sp. TSO22-1 TaxID=716789 RepID=UPI001304B613|nr:EipA family protein [Azospirillum sp. TSO22-1]